MQTRNKSTAWAIVAAAGTAVFAALGCALLIGLGVDPVADSSWGARWEIRAKPPSYYQIEALAALSRTVFLVAASTGFVALVSLLVHAVSRLIAGWRGLAIRVAIGAGYRALVATTLPGLARLLVLGVVMGSIAGFVTLARRPSVPGLLVRPAASAWWLSALGAAALLLVLLALTVLPLLLVLHRRRRLTGDLVGEQVTSAVGHLRFQRALATIQLAALLTVTYAGALIVRASPLAAPGEVHLDTSDATILPLRMAGDGARQPRQRAEAWTALQRALGPEAVLSSPAAWLGFGKSLEVLGLCNSCFIGQNFAPMTYARVRVIAVAPGALPGMRLERFGRGFSTADDYDAPRVAVISQQAAHELFPQANPVGQLIRTGLSAGADYRVIGVVRNLAPRGLGAAGKPIAAMYVSALQHPPLLAEIALPATAGAAARERLRAARSGLGATVHPDIRLEFGRPVPLVTALRRFAAPLAWFGRLAALLGALGMLLSLYAFGAVMMQLVRIRRKDIAIRLALGARPWHVVGWVTGHGVAIALYGVLVGATGARFAGDALRRTLSRSDEGDAVVLLALIASFALVAFLASYLPARLASRTDPAAIWRER